MITQEQIERLNILSLTVGDSSVYILSEEVDAIKAAIETIRFYESSQPESKAAACDIDIEVIVSALEHSVPKLVWYPEPVQRHAEALAAARALLSAKGGV